MPNILLQIKLKKQLRKVFPLFNLFSYKDIFFYCMPYPQNYKSEFVFIIISLLILKYSFLLLMPRVTPHDENISSAGSNRFVVRTYFYLECIVLDSLRTFAIVILMNHKRKYFHSFLRNLK